MGNWQHTYNAAAIGANETIQSHRPKEKLSDAITELQNKVVIAATANVTGAYLEATVNDNVLDISGEIGATLPDGGSEYQVLQRNGSGDAVWGWVRAHY